MSALFPAQSPCIVVHPHPCHHAHDRLVHAGMLHVLSAWACNNSDMLSAPQTEPHSPQGEQTLVHMHVCRRCGRQGPAVPS